MASLKSVVASDHKGSGHYQDVSGNDNSGCGTNHNGVGTNFKGGGANNGDSANHNGGATTIMTGMLHNDSGVKQQRLRQIQRRSRRSQQW